MFQWLGEWLNVLIAACALYLAWCAGKQAKQLYQEDKARERQQEALRRRSEPAKLSVWFAARKNETYAWGIVFNNVAERPFYNLQLEGEYFVKESAQAFSYDFARVIPPGRFFVPFNYNEPDGPYLFRHPEDYDDNCLTPLLTSKKHMIRRIRFTDSDGFQWESDGQGNLRETAQPAA